MNMQTGMGGSGTSNNLDNMTQAQILGIIHTFLKCAVDTARVVSYIRNKSEVEVLDIVDSLKFETVSEHGAGKKCALVFNRLFNGGQNDEPSENAGEFEDFIASLLENVRYATFMLSRNRRAEYISTLVHVITLNLDIKKVYDGEITSISSELARLEEESEVLDDSDSDSDSNVDDLEQSIYQNIDIFNADWDYAMQIWDNGWNPSTPLEEIGVRAIRLIENLSFKQNVE